MLLKTGMIILVVLGEIALGIYSFLFTDSLIARFLFFVFTCFLVALLVFRFAAQARENKESPTPVSDENTNTENSDENRKVNPV